MVRPPDSSEDEAESEDEDSGEEDYDDIEAAAADEADILEAISQEADPTTPPAEPPEGAKRGSDRRWGDDEEPVPKRATTPVTGDELGCDPFGTDSNIFEGMDVWATSE